MVSKALQLVNEKLLATLPSNGELYGLQRPTVKPRITLFILIAVVVQMLQGVSALKGALVAFTWRNLTKNLTKVKPARF